MKRLTVVKEPIVADTLYELLLKLHATFGIAIEEIEESTLFVSEVS